MWVIETDTCVCTKIVTYGVRTGRPAGLLPKSMLFHPSMLLVSLFALRNWIQEE